MHSSVAEVEWYPTHLRTDMIASFWFVANYESPLNLYTGTSSTSSSSIASDIGYLRYYHVRVAAQMQVKIVR